MKMTNTFSRMTMALVAGAFAAFVGGTALAADAVVNHADKSFLQDAYQANMAEIRMGEMAQGKTGSPEVKAFAEKMIEDHTKASADVKALSDSKKVDVSTDPTMMAKLKAKMDDHKTGADFDKAFAADMVSDHKSVVEAFEKAAKESTDADVKALAEKMLPKLKEHLSMAYALQDKVGK